MAKNRKNAHRAPDQNKKIEQSVFEIGNDAIMDAKFFKLPEAVQQQANIPTKKKRKKSQNGAHLNM